MPSQEITDYLTKEVLIERNVVTFRLLSRHFSIHVNAAKEELAAFHQATRFQAQRCAATYQLSGVLIPLRGADRGGASQTQSSFGDDFEMDLDKEGVDNYGFEEEDSEPVERVTMLVVPEAELEEAKAGFETLYSAIVYSLSPAPINDADLLCAPTVDVRKADKAGGSKLAQTVGRVVGTEVKIGPAKKGAPVPAPVAGPSKIKGTVGTTSATSSAKSKPAETKTSSITRQDTKPDVVSADKAKGKGSATSSKMQFFKAVNPMDKVKLEDKTKEKEKEKSKVEVKKEPPAASKRTFFSAASVKESTSKAASPSPAHSPASEEESEKPTRGVKRKSSIGIQQAKIKVESTPPPPPAVSAKAKAKVKEETPEMNARKRVILSDDDDDDEPIVKPSRRQKRRAVHADDDDEGNDAAMALMDVDDDFVEKIPRPVSAPPSTVYTDDDDDMKDEGLDTSLEEKGDDDDVEMDDEPVVKAVKKPREKKVVPIGSNGLKKRKVTKTRKVADANGYLCMEDYTDWESVDEEEPEPAKKAKKPVVKTTVAKAKSKASPKEVEKDEVLSGTPPPQQTKTAPAAKAPAKPKLKAPAAGAKAKQQGLLHFFGPKK